MEDDRGSSSNPIVIDTTTDSGGGDNANDDGDSDRKPSTSSGIRKDLEVSPNIEKLLGRTRAVSVSSNDSNEFVRQMESPPVRYA